MRKVLLAGFAVVLAGCQTWGPTWSEVTGARYSTGEIQQYRRPAVIERIDDQGAFAQYPVKIEPGAHRIVLGGPAPGWPGGAELKVFTLDAAPCKRYYINAQFLNNIQPEWSPTIDYVEDIAGCRIT
jgi:hypothetical protein